MSPRILFDRLHLQQKKLCGVKYIQLHNVFLLTADEVQKELVTTRFADVKTDAIRFASKGEGYRQAYLYFMRLANKGGSLQDFLKRVQKHHAPQLVAHIQPFYKFPITLKTNVRELCDE